VVEELLHARLEVYTVLPLTDQIMSLFCTSSCKKIRHAFYLHDQIGILLILTKPDFFTKPSSVIQKSPKQFLLQTTNPDSEGLGYLVLDMQGRMLKEGLGNGNEVLLHQFSNTVASGIYLVGVKSKQSFRTYKIFVP